MAGTGREPAVTSSHDRPASPEGQASAHPVAKADLAVKDAALRDRVVSLERLQAQVEALGGSVVGHAEQYSTILDMVADGFCLLDSTGRFLDANEAYSRMSGYTRHELLTLDLSAVECTVAREDIARRIQEIMQVGSARFESRHRRKDGQLVDLDVSMSFLRANGGRFSCLLRDITERKAAARALEMRTRQLEVVRAVAEEMTRELDLTRLLDIILRRTLELVGASAGVIRLWNESTQTLVPAAAQGEGKLLWPLQLGEGVSGVAAERRQGMIVNDYRTSPYATRRHLEQTTVSAVLAEPLFYRERLVGVVAVGRNMGQEPFVPEEAYVLRLLATQAAIAIENARLYEAAQRELAERTRTEVAMSEERNLLRTLMDSIPDRVYVKDAAGRYVVDNLAHQHCLGVTSLEEVVGKTIFDFYPRELAERFHQDDLDVMASGSPSLNKEEHFADRPTHESRWDLTNKIPLRDGRGAIVGVISIARNITARKRMEEALQARATQLEAVRTVAEEITRELDLSCLLELIVRRAADLVGAAGGSIYLWSDAEQALVPQAWSRNGTWMSRHRLRLNEGLAGTVAARREGLIVNDYRRWPSASPCVLEQSRITAAVAEPLLYRERLVGVMVVDTDEGGRIFTEGDRQSLCLLASHVAIAIENARLHQAAVRQSEELGALLRASRSVMAGLNLQQTLEVIASEAARIAHCEHVKLLVVDKEAQVLRIGVLRGLAAPDGFPLRIGTGLSGKVAESGQPLYIDDTQNDPRSLLAAFDRALGLRTYLGLPVKIRDEVLGVLTFNTLEPRQYTADELAYLTSFADHAAIAIENARLHEAANRRSERLATLNTLNRTLTTATDPEQVVHQILAALDVLIPGAVARLWLRDPGQPDRWRLTASAGLRDPDAAKTLLVRPTDGLVGVAVAGREAITSPDLLADPRFANHRWAEAEGLRSSVMLPLVFGDQVHGVLAVSTRVRHDFDGEEVELLRSFAAQSVIALENARLFAELKRAYEDLSRAQDGLIRSEKLRALGQMAAGIAHDLNNILAAILGQTDLLRLRASDRPVQEALNTLELAATDAAEVVRRLQDFSRQQASRPLGPVDLAALVREVLEITKPRWKDDPEQRGATIDARVSLDPLPPVLGHAPEIREALTNLILNAVDAMPNGGTLTIAGRECADAVVLDPGKEIAVADGISPGATEDGRAAELTVTDSGVGMTSEVCHRIFDPFFTTKGVKGTGLGLSVVYGIMQRHGGRIDVTSSPGEGTTFRLRFLVAAEGLVAPSPTVSGLTVRPRCILLIDDDAAVRRTMTELLQEVGHTVIAAEGGAEGLEHLGMSRVDLVITDLGMPGMTGWEVARAVKAVALHPPVILLTGWGERPASHSEHAGLVDRVFGKPVRLDELLAAIRDLTPSADEPGDVPA